MSDILTDLNKMPGWTSYPVDPHTANVRIKISMVLRDKIDNEEWDRPNVAGCSRTGREKNPFEGRSEGVGRMHVEAEGLKPAANES